MSSGGTRLFVYGTLLSGQPAHEKIARARFVGEASTAPTFELHDLGDYPAMVAGGTRVARGELYEVDAGLLAELDEYEGHPDLFQRTAIVLDDSSAAEAYLLHPSKAARWPILATADWRARVRGRP